jgi:spore coat protein JB
MDNNSREMLMRRVQELSFAKVETELYLDAHPENKRALEYYRTILEQLDEAMTEYQNKYGPLFAEGVVGDSWTWAKGKWPWHLDSDSIGEEK